MASSHPQRKRIRLESFDYSNPGTYFLTVVTHNRKCYFGNIEREEMCLNPAGRMLDLWWRELVKKFPGVELHEYCIMPNHFHAIVMLHEGDGPAGSRPDLQAVVQWYKTMTTNAYILGVRNQGWQPFAGTLWQRSYYDHIIRDEADLQRVREYIVNNPLKWAIDEENPQK